MMEKFIEKVAYESLKEINPALLTAIESTLKQGGTAKQVERKLVQRYGNGSVVIDGAILAARYIEAQRKA